MKYIFLENEDFIQYADFSNSVVYLLNKTRDDMQYPDELIINEISEDLLSTSAMKLPAMMSYANQHYLENYSKTTEDGETTFTDSKGTFIASGCGERGVKGNAVVIGPNAQIDASVITSYITDPENPEYTTFDGIFVAKGNVTKEGNVVGNADTSSDEAAKASGYADVYGRNGKCSKGVFGTTNTELKGIAIIGSLTAHNNVDTGNAQNLHVNQILKAAANAVETVQEAYIAVPYEGDPIV